MYDSYPLENCPVGTTKPACTPICNLPVCADKCVKINILLAIVLLQVIATSLSKRFTTIFVLP